MARIDAHCHAWSQWPYQPPVPDPSHRGAVEQLLYEMDTHDVDAATIVCARIGDNDDNNDYVARAAARHPDRLFQFVDFDSRWSTTHHTEGAPDRLRTLCDRLQPAGFTHYVNDVDDGWFVSDEGFEVFAIAAERGLIVSLAAPPHWHESIRRVATEFGTVPILLHHLGGLRPQQPDHATQLDELRQTADVPNVFVKLSGWRYASDSPHEYPYRDVMETVRFLYQTFGPSRLCWGSNYPVERPFTTYRQTTDVLRVHCDFITEDDQDRILGHTMSGLLSGSRDFS